VRLHVDLHPKNVRKAKLEGCLPKGTTHRNAEEKTSSFYLPWLTAESCRISSADNPTTLPSRQM